MRFDDAVRWFGGESGHGGHGGRHGGPGAPGAPGGFGGRGRGRPGFGFGGPGWAEMFRERPQRAERGGVRYLVLDAVRDTPRHGYEIMTVIGERTGGAYKPSPGVVYPTLQMLEELGHVKVAEVEGKKVYAITPAGTADLAEHGDEVASFYEQSEDVWEDHRDDLQAVMHRVRGLVHSFRRAARRGRLTPDVMKKIRAILEETATRLEAVVGLDDER